MITINQNVNSNNYMNTFKAKGNNKPIYKKMTKSEMEKELKKEEKEIPIGSYLKEFDNPVGVLGCGLAAGILAIVINLIKIFLKLIF